MLSTGARRAVRAWTVLVLVFLYAPLLLVVINAFNASRTFAFPPSGFTLRWWVDAANSQGMWKSLANSVVVGLGATVIALALGTMAAFAVQRYVVLRPQRCEFPCGVADYVAWHRHRHRAQRDVHLRAGRDAGPGDRDRRSRDVLHRHRVQQHPGPVATTGHQPRGCVGRPRRVIRGRRSGT